MYSYMRREHLERADEKLLKQSKVLSDTRKGSF